MTLRCRRFRTVGPECLIHVRIDAAGDCAELLKQLEALGVWYYTKGRISQDLAATITTCRAWRSIDHDAMSRPTRQGAEIMFQRDEWNRVGITPRVVAIRSRDRENGKQLYLWNDLEYTVQYRTKRDLADSLLEGTDRATALSLDELRSLIEA